MNKIEVFLPLPGMAAAMDQYFTDLDVIYLGGLPTGPELPKADLTEDELLALGLDAAQDKVDRLTLSKLEGYTVNPDAPYIAEFIDSAGEQIGWEFEYQVNADY